MNSMAVTVAVLLVGIAACVVAGVSMETAPLCDSWMRQMPHSGILDFHAEGLPFRIGEGAYARLVGLRLSGWLPIAPLGFFVCAWLLTWALDRRAVPERIPSPAIAFLAKRVFCLGILLGGLSVAAPIEIPAWFGFVPWALLGGSAHIYVANLPERL